ncbi:MAG: methyltransferase, partial [Flammeovirgaceae bacterium]|nr:methyltransferase [Flammeovirgaceae bacterium]
MSNKMKISDLWRHILDNHITSKSVKSLEQFKRGPINFKISLWDPEKNGVRYLKMLIYNISSSLTSKQWSIIKKTKNRDVGAPVSVKIDDESICLDYAQSALETDFILSSTAPKKVLEIGAGYGRTCHTIIENIDLDEYVIIDLPECLQLSKEYLCKVLDK